MMKFLGKLAVLTAVMISAAGLHCFADDTGEVMALRQQVKDLTSKLNSLENKVSGLSVAPREPIVPSGGAQQGGLIHTMQDIRMGGYIDVEYNQNLSNEISNNAAGTAAAITSGQGNAAAGGNPGRVFDNSQNTFTMNAAVLEFQKDPNPEGGVGFRFDLASGYNAKAVDLASTGVRGGDVTFEQAYVDIVAPLSFMKGSDIFDDVIDIKVGRYWTLAGAEVVRSPDNWNVSRSLAFGYALPFSHTGARATYKLFNDKVTTFVGLNNGWDNVVDNNKLKTMEGGFSFSPIENVTWTTSMYLGPEMNFQSVNGANHRRFLISNVALWNATNKLSLMGEFNFGNENRVGGLQNNLGTGVSGLNSSNAQWYTMAGYARYKLTDKWATAYRAEVFFDADTYRFEGTNGISKDRWNIWEQTLTLEYNIYENLIGRLEYRVDKSDDTDVFQGHATQQTIGGQLIYTFA